jgi:hypothetical protein
MLGFEAQRVRRRALLAEAIPKRPVGLAVSYAAEGQSLRALARIAVSIRPAVRVEAILSAVADFVWVWW